MYIVRLLSCITSSTRCDVDDVNVNKNGYVDNASSIPVQHRQIFDVENDDDVNSKELSEMLTR